MKLPQNYMPCFTSVPDDWRGRWSLLREFTRRWHGIPVGDAGEPSALADEEEAKLGVTLPPSFREWLGYCEELMAISRGEDDTAFEILRDAYEVVRLEVEEHRAISLLIQGEADYYWAVKEEHLTQDDPPVDGYPLDYERPFSESHFRHDGEVAPHITSFVLERLAYFLHGNGGGALVTVKLNDKFLAQMRAAFPVAVRFDHLYLFEKENIFALLIPHQHHPTEYLLSVDIWQPVPRNQVPDCIWENLRRGGAFHGMLYTG